MTRLYEEREEELFNPAMTDKALANLTRVRFEQFLQYRKELRKRGYTLRFDAKDSILIEKTEIKKTVL